MLRNTDANKRKLLEILKETPLIQGACQRLGINRATYYRWVNDDSEFREAANQALNISGGIVTDLAQSKLIDLIKQGNLPAIIFWLSRRSVNFAQQPIRLSGGSNDIDPVEALLRAYGLVAGGDLPERQRNRFLPKSRKKGIHSGPRRIILDDGYLNGSETRDAEDGETGAAVLRK